MKCFEMTHDFFYIYFSSPEKITRIRSHLTQWLTPKRAADAKHPEECNCVGGFREILQLKTFSLTSKCFSSFCLSRFLLFFLFRLP